MMTKETLDALVALGAKEPRILQEVTEQGQSVPVVVIPVGTKVESLEQYFPPTRIQQRVILLEAGSFIEYVNHFKGPDTLIFANVSETGADFTAVLDYHGAAPELDPAYCSHIAKFTAIETPEWKTWKAANRQAMDQVKFATFLEDNLTLFVDPSGAALLELVKSLHGHRNARFTSSLRLDNGSYAVSYDEDISVRGTSSTQSGALELPPVIKAGMRVFQGADAYEIPARLKSRCEERKLVLYFETIGLPTIVRESILLLVKQIEDGTSIIPLLGNPA